jgi:hypothetical protein
LRSNEERKADGLNKIEHDINQPVTWNVVINSLDRALFAISFLAVVLAIGVLFPRY